MHASKPPRGCEGRSPLCSRGTAHLGVLGLLCSLALAPATAHAGWARFALVVGYNDSDDPALTSLRYADDDAVKHAQLLSLMTERTVLLTHLDAESRGLYGNLDYREPTRANVLGALESLHKDMARAKARGDDPVLFFVYSGHGNYDQEGRGYVHLEDGRFTTRDTYYEVLGPTEGESPHHVILVVDACNAALLVNSRGPTRRRATTTAPRLENYPRVGVVLSSSSVGEVHEWGRLLSGVFSHEVRSALMGAGDLNDDGAVTFPELAAFVAAANSQVKNEAYRIKPYIRPPLSAPNMPILNFRDARFPARLRIDGKVSGRSHLVNTELLRFADFNKAGASGFWLGLPSTDGFTLISGATEYVVPAGARGDLQMAALTTRPVDTLAGRGADRYFEERLFAEPLSPESGRDWVASAYSPSLVVERHDVVPWYENRGAWAVTALGAGLLGTAVGLHVESELGFGALNDDPGAYDSVQAQDLRDQYLGFRHGAIAAYSVGGAALLGGILWFALDESFRVDRYEPPLRVTLTPSGIELEATF